MVAEGVADEVTDPMVSAFGGPVGPGTVESAPLSPFSPFGKTRLIVWLGAVPVMVAEGVEPDVTVPTLRVFAGPSGPIGPFGPAGSERLKVSTPSIF